MTKILVSHKTLSAVVSKCSRFVGKGADVTAHLLFEATSLFNTLTITACDYTMGYTQFVYSAEILGEGKVTIEAKRLVEILKRLPKDEKIVIEGEGGEVFVKGGKVTYKLLGYCVDVFPALASLRYVEFLQYSELRLDSSVCAKKFKALAHAMDKGNPKPSLNGVLVSVRSNEFAFAASDTKRLAFSYVKTPKNPKTFDFVVPKQAAIEISKLLGEGAYAKTYCLNARVEEFGEDPKTARVFVAYGSDFIVFTRTINDKFPDFERVIGDKPLLSYETLNFGTKTLKDGLDKFSANADRIVINLLKNGEAVYSTHNTELVTTKIRAVVKHNLSLRDNFVAIFNTKFLSDFVKTITDNGEMGFKMRLENPIQPMLLEANEFSELIMPVIDSAGEGFVRQNESLYDSYVNTREKQLIAIRLRQRYADKLAALRAAKAKSAQVEAQDAKTTAEIA